MSSIRGLSESTVHRIATNQVVVSLAIGVKELVENALDAGATQLQIRFGDFGAEFFEVSDNGHGIDPSVYEQVVARHATSKIENFTDLDTIGTFGFRGEALAALAAISDKLTITTKTESESIGAEIVYDEMGTIKSQKKAIRKTGTSVRVEKLFHRIPVRRQIFVKNEKRELQKAYTTLMQYALMSSARFLVQSSVKKSQFTTQMQTRAGDELGKKLTAVFGAELARQLEKVPEAPALTSSSAIKFFGLDETDEAKIDQAIESARAFTYSGYITRQGEPGRAANDRQFFYINNRPVDLPFLARILNSEWRQMTSKGAPAAVINLEMNQRDVDVNLAPDKRTVLLKNRKYAEFAFKSLLDAHWGRSAQSSEIGTIMHQTQMDSFLCPPPEPPPQASQPDDKENLPQMVNESDYKIEIMEKHADNEVIEVNNDIGGLKIEIMRPKVQEKNERSEEINDIEIIKSVKEPHKEPITKRSDPVQMPIDNFIEHDVIDRKTDRLASDAAYFIDFEAKVGNERDKEEEKDVSIDLFDSEQVAHSTQNQTDVALFEPEVSEVMQIYDDEIHETKIMEDGLLKFDFERLKENIEKERDQNEVEFEGRKFVADLQDTKKAESELSRKFTKADFLKMKVIGQFNKGFIIGLLGDDLFIIDQHASDEKYNFEQLNSQKPKIEKMLVPKRVNLNPGDVQVLIEKRNIFEKVGFKFNINEDEGTVDIVESARYGKELLDESDIQEMIFVLSKGEYSCQPSKIRRLNASRACRGAIMIGSSLSEARMVQILTHLSELDQPWNCPHGRPTMRHLGSLSMF